MNEVNDFVIRGKRLILRQWRETDLAPFAALNADPRVMEYFPKLLTREESDAMADKLANNIRQYGFGLWAAEVPGVAPLIGFVGIQKPSFETPFSPCIEVGWRLASEHWGHGYATEAAAAALDYAFTQSGVTEIFAFTVPKNQRSRRVMEKLGMIHSQADDFDYPNVPVGHPLRRLTVYKLSRSVWKSLSATV